MNVTHNLSDSAITKTVEHPVAFIQVNERKDFATFYTRQQSRYEGLFIVRNGSFVKTVSRIERVASGGEGVVAPQALEIYRQESVATRRFDGSKGEFYTLVKDEPALIYEATNKSKAAREELVVRLDVREQFDIPQWGRAYVVREEPGLVVVSYSDEHLVDPVFLAVAHDGIFAADGAWVAVEYPRDLQRNSHPAVLYEYVLGTFSAGKLVFAYGDTEAEAVERARRFAGYSSLKVIAKKRLRPKKANGLDTVSQGLARACAREALEALYVDGSMLAGMPWFTRAWVRDELISAPAMPKAKAHAIAAKYIDAEWRRGRLPVIFGGENFCSDGLGLLAWAILFGRIELSEGEKATLAKKLKAAITALEEQANELGFIPSDERESWMDSIGRTGYPIETQALYVRILQLAELLLSDSETYQNKREAFISAIRAHYFKDSYLHDRIGDASIRPNVFLAALFAPEILNKAEWEECFDAVLPCLWLSWGGLASVDTRSACFCDVSAGECDTSYHNGDSWFFVNNIAALVMHSVNSTKYASYIDAVFNASTEEILWHNFAGCPGEISSACTLDSWGCGLQGFSAAAYLYLADHVPLKRRGLKNLFGKVGKVKT